MRFITVLVLVAIGIGVMFTLTIYLVQTSLLSQIVRSAPANYPNFFVLGITERDREQDPAHVAGDAGPFRAQPLDGLLQRAFKSRHR